MTVWNTCGYVFGKLHFISWKFNMLLKNLQRYHFFWDTVYNVCLLFCFHLSAAASLLMLDSFSVKSWKLIYNCLAKASKLVITTDFEVDFQDVSLWAAGCDDHTVPLSDQLLFSGRDSNAADARSSQQVVDQKHSGCRISERLGLLPLLVLKAPICWWWCYNQWMRTMHAVRRWFRCDSNDYAALNHWVLHLLTLSVAEWYTSLVSTSRHLLPVILLSSVDQRLCTPEAGQTCRPAARARPTPVRAN